MIKRSLPIRILLITLFCFALPILLYFFIIFRQEYRNELKSHFNSLLVKGRCREKVFETLFNDRLIMNNILLEVLNIPNASLPNDSMNEKLQSLAKAAGFPLIFYLEIQPGNQLIAAASSDKNMIHEDLSDYAYLQQSILKGQMGYLNYGVTVDEKYFFVVNTVYSEDKHRPVGVFGTATAAENILEQMFRSEIGRYPINFAILTEDEIVYASSDPSFDLLRLKPLSPERVEQIRKGKEVGAFITEEANIVFTPIKGLENAYEWEWQGKKKIGAFIPIQNMNLTLLVYADEGQIFQKQYKDLFRFVLIFCLITALTSWMTFWLTRRMARPLKQLQKVMQRVGKGDYSARFTEDRMGYEINAIGETLNETIVELLEHMEAVKNERVEKETLAKELNIGRNIQLSILPQEMPVYPAVDIAAGTKPAKEVCGDFFDFYIHTPVEDPESPKLAVTIADAAGKGISACLYSLCLRSMLRSYVAEYQDVGKVIRLANNLFYQDTEESSMFVTVFLGLFDSETGEFDYLSAGHHPVLLRRGDGTIERLETGHIAMGVIQLEELTHKKAMLRAGDLLIFYTDGVTEALSISEKLYGEKRLIDVIEHNANQSVSTIWNAIIEDIKNFSAGAPQHDDITLIVMRVM